MMGTAYVMYHELEVPGRAPCHTDPGYLRYVVTEPHFRSHLERLVQIGCEGRSVGRTLGAPPTNHPTVALTFDDGTETDLLVAAPLLREVGYDATFYITVGFVGQPGYLTLPQIRELHEGGFEIGCHSMTHAYLSDCSTRQLETEVVESRNRLQDLLGAPVLHLSCPGGRWSPRVSDVALDAGYLSVATSRIGLNAVPPDRRRIRRVPILRGTTPAAMGRLVQGRGLFRRRAGEMVRGAAKSVLGNARYEAVRARMLRSTR